MLSVPRPGRAIARFKEERDRATVCKLCPHNRSGSGRRHLCPGAVAKFPRFTDLADYLPVDDLTTEQNHPLSRGVIRRSTSVPRAWTGIRHLGPFGAVPFPRIVKKPASDLPAKKHRSATVVVIGHGVKGSGRWTSVGHLRPVLPIPFPSISKRRTRIRNI